MSRPWLDLVVGCFVLIGIVALGFLALRVANLTDVGGGELYRVHATFENVGGLKERAPVKSAGVVVGRVLQIRFDAEQHRAVVTVGLDPRYRFSTDSSMSILTSGLLGEQYIGIETGADDAMLGPGDSVWLTSSAVVLEDLIGAVLLSGGTASAGTQP